MAGFSPVGSTPVASLGGGGINGAVYQPLAAWARFGGQYGTVTYTYSQNRVTWTGMEVLRGGVALARETWTGVEVLRSLVNVSLPWMSWIGMEVLVQMSSPRYTTWIGMEVLGGGDAKARTTWIGLEVLDGGQPQARTTWIGMEILTDLLASTVEEPQVSILW